MKFEKILTRAWSMCYVASSLTLDGTVYGAFASESHDTTGAVALDARLQEMPLWDAPGGCMGIIQVPGMEEFLTIQRFYPVFQSEQAEIAWYYRKHGAWVRKVLLTVPFVHRIELLRENGAWYLLICKLYQSKAIIDDWSTAGSVLACRLLPEHRSVGPLVTVLEGLYKNHGLVRIPGDNDRALVAHSDGVHELSMDDAGRWQSRQIWDEPCSDVALTGLQSDGSYGELGVITPFHGGDFRVLRREDDRWTERCCFHDAFGHGIWGGTLAGVPCYLVGFRAGSQGIYCIEPQQGTFRITPVDTGVGNANLTVFRWDGRHYIGAANRESNTFTIYCASAE